jgi:hypothetical protein
MDIQGDMSLAAEILDRFGKRVDLADELGVPLSTLNNWPSSGIPWKRHRAFMALAARNGITLSRDELEATLEENGAGDMDISGPSAPALPERGNADA